MQTRAAYKGHGLQNEAAPFLAEYCQRKRLAKLGFVTNINELSAYKADIFSMIDAEIDSIQIEQSKRSHGKR